MRKTVPFLMLILIAATTPAPAADNGFFLGLGIGRSSLKPTEYYPEFGGAHLSQKSYPYKVYGGYRFLKHLAIEAGFVDLGSPQSFETVVTTHPKTLEVSVSGWDAFAVGLLPVGRVDVFAKIGVISWDAGISVSQDAEEIFSDSHSGSDPAYGIGLSIRLGSLVWLRGEVEQFTIGDFEDVAMYTIGVMFSI